MGFACDAIERLAWTIGNLKHPDQALLVVALVFAALCSSALGEYVRGRNRRRAMRELDALRDDLRASNKVVTLDVAIGVCRRLADIENRYGEKLTVQVLVVDSHGVPARLTLTAN